jgi:hypothetical protein
MHQLDPHVEELRRRLLQRGDLFHVQVWFNQAVLDKYRGSSAYQVVRTDTIGRLSRPRMWSLDFGIAGDGDSLIHASLKDLLERLPETEREHWASKMVTLPVSGLFVHTRITQGSCIDDGPLRAW